MTDRPIIFSGAMVRAILDGRKTQTRRLLRDLVGDLDRPFMMDDGSWHVVDSHGGNMSPLSIRYRAGDRLFPAMPIPSLNRNYCADLHGRIWSRAKDGQTWELLKGSATSKGYLSVTPAHDGRYKTRLVHRLVAEAFYGHEPDGLKQVRHLNGDQRDNAPENLDWGTQEDNWSDRYAHGRGSGEDHHAARLTSDQVEAIRAAADSQRVLAARFGVAQSTIWAIRSGRFWQVNPAPNLPNCPRWASRLTLTVTDVRVQRLQEISEEDARAEGCRSSGPLPGHEDDSNAPPHRDACENFADLWDSLNAKRAPWSSNPWCCAISFSAEKAHIDALPREAA